MKKIRIRERIIGDDEKVFIIAEIGVNHNGSFQIAKRLIDVAVEAGCDAVKFQKRSLPSVYQREILEDPNQGEQSFQYLIPILREVELSEKDYIQIVKYCKEKGIMFLCTPWDEDSVDFLEKLDVPAYKIASADMTNLILLEYLAGKKKPLILSTGMSTMEEIETVVEFLKAHQVEFALLHCNSTYPAPFKELNLRCIQAFKEKFGVPVGYSGHERGIAMTCSSIALGACIIERHITLDRAMVGPDHASSLEPQGIEKLVSNIRHLEIALGVGKRTMSQGEILNRELLGKSLVAKVAIAKGTLITREMITAKSPGKSLSPLRLLELVGTKALRDIHKDDAFTDEDLGEKNEFEKPILNFNWGLKVRFQNLEQLTPYHPNFFEFHMTDKDLEVPLPNRNYPQELYIHAPEYVYRQMVDLCSTDENQRKESVDIMKRTIDKTLEMKPFFLGRPKLIVHVGGMSLEPLSDMQLLLDKLRLSLNELDFSEVDFMPENLPPYPWYFSGQWISNLFAKPEDMVTFCKEWNCKMCLDTSHAALYCNAVGRKLSEYISITKPYVGHMHVSDAAGTDGEGLQIGEGTIDFVEVFKIMKGYKGSIVPEIWRGHQNGGRAFFVALKRLADVVEKGLAPEELSSTVT